MVVTRFNPTANGSLHLGHVFTLLVNEQFAHSMGGRFIVRIDDTSGTAKKTGSRMSTIAENQLMDIVWLDVGIDSVYSQSDMIDAVHHHLTVDLGFNAPSEPENGLYKVPYYVRLGNNFISYPYTPIQTAERVIMDNLLGVTHLIRGDDFLTEYSYYCYLCQIFSLPTPEFIFLPRLSGISGDISKTNGGYTIAEFRQDGYTPQDIKDILARSCLITPASGWRLDNIKSNPILKI